MRAPGATDNQVGAPVTSVQAQSVLLTSTPAFMACSVVWMMFGVIGIQLREDLKLNDTESGLLASTPVPTGALMRLPLGVWTDRFDGRIVMTTLLVVCAVPVYAVSYAIALWQLLVTGLFPGCIGAPFTVGASYVTRFFPQERRGFAMGFFGASTSGAAINLFLTSSLQAVHGWRFVPRAYAVALLVTAVISWLTSASDPGTGRTQGSWVGSFKVLRDRCVWRLCQYYSITFGGFAALSLRMPQYLKNEHGMTLVAASTSAAEFSLSGLVLRAVGGWLADRWDAQNVTWWELWVTWVCLPLLAYLPTDPVIHIIDGVFNLHLQIPLATFIVLIFLMGSTFAFGMVPTFKYAVDDFSANMEVVTDIVGLAGGLGGFPLPVIFGVLLDVFRVRLSCFVFLYGTVWMPLILLYLSRVRRASPTGHAGQGAIQ